jgi:flagellar biosynthesis protein FliP
LNPPSFLGLVAGLAVVLGLISVLVRVLKLLSRGDPRSGDGADLQVLSRVALAPRQGLAAVRFQGRSALVSYGEGGVRLLMEREDEEAERNRKQLGDPVPALPTTVGEDGMGSRMGMPGEAVRAWAGPTGASASRGGVTVWTRVRGAARAVGLAFVLVLALQALQPAVVAGGSSGDGLTGEEMEEEMTHLQSSGVDQVGVVTDSPTGLTGLGLEGRSFPSIDLRLGTEEEALRLSGPVGTVIFIGFLTLLPTLVLLMTGFTRILVVLHLLRQALGTQAAPPAHLLAAMALLLTGFVMAPTLSEVNRTALAPWTAGEMNEAEMLQAAALPFREFMLHAAREQDLETFVEFQGGPLPESVDDLSLIVVTSAFVTSELRTAFQMGFALFLPFVVIDLVVASVLMSMGMFMLPPVMVSLPFKLLLFVLVDGWSLVVGGIVRSFQGG